MKLICEDILYDQEKIYCFASNLNLLFYIDCRTGEYVFLGSIPDRDFFATRLVSKIVLWNQQLILIPLVSGSIWLFSLKDLSWRKFEIAQYENNWANSFFRNAICYNNKLYVFGGYYPAVIEIDLASGIIRYDKKPFVDKNNDSVKDLFFRGVPLLHEGLVYLASGFENSIFIYNLDSHEFEWRYIGGIENRYSGIEYEAGYFWLSPRKSGMNIVKFSGDSTKTILVPLEGIKPDTYIGIIKMSNQFVIPSTGGRSGSIFVKSETLIEKKLIYYSVYKKQDDLVITQQQNGNIEIIDEYFNDIYKFSGSVEDKKSIELLKSLQIATKRGERGLVNENDPVTLGEWISIIMKG